MHPSRRRKKRPNYGIRTVEVVRGPNGFGFTISGQQPCILSCIVNNSPADQAGLRAGDFLISVNGVSVSKMAHDSVVSLIGNCITPIKMTIAENYYSDSSDEEFEYGRMVNSRKPKYTSKPKTHRSYKADTPEKNVMKMRECISKHNGNEPRLNANVFNEEPVINDRLNESNSVPMDDEAGPIEYKVLVGYLGTIEMPKQLLPNSRLQTVCSCIRKLRQEKRTPTTVLMTILPTCLTLKNDSNHILAIYPTNRVVYVGSTSDRESRYFGLVTSAVCDTRNDSLQKKYGENFWQMNEKKSNNLDLEIEISNSCHVFVTDPKIVTHNIHSRKADSFKIVCTTDIVTGSCLEFPSNALYIVSLIQNMYKLQSEVNLRQDNNMPIVANSPQPSASSNSDSGIGFRDDCGNISDRILVVEFPKHRPLIPVLNNTSNRPQAIEESNINLEALDCNVQYNNDNSQQFELNNIRAQNAVIDRQINLLRNDNTDAKHLNNLNNVRACEGGVIKNNIEKPESYLAKQNNDGTSSEYVSRLTCRAMPDPASSHSYTERPVDVPENAVSEDFDIKSSIDNISVQSCKSSELNNLIHVFCVPKKIKRPQKFVMSCDNLNEKVKSSPMARRPNFSCEELNHLESVEKFGFGSLQDLCNWDSKKSRARKHIAQSEPDVRLQRPEEYKMCDQNGNAKNSSADGPASWATSFEKLLEDPLGLQAFAEFLKKEFSAENIYFWTACERFRKLPSGGDRTAEALRIYQQHLNIGAPEAVNVDSHGRQCTENALNNPESNIFDQAQKQIFNLMKFDSYPRFLKSDIYKQCLSGHINPKSLDTRLIVQHPTPTKLKKSLSNAEDRRRKSLLRWHRKNRSKSKDRCDSDCVSKHFELRVGVDNGLGYGGLGGADIHSSKSSLTSLDLAAVNQDISLPNDMSSEKRPALCRVRLSNGSTTVVQIKQGEVIQQLVTRLLDKRGLTYSSFEVLTNKHSKPLDVNEPSSKLAGCEVTVEQRVVFKLDLPNKKIISVKSKFTKIIIDVLRPILHKYNYNLEQVTVTNNNAFVDMMQTVTSIDGARLNVQLKRDEQTQNLTVHADSSKNKLEEITNKVFEGILQEKSDVGMFKHSRSDKGSVKSEDWGSEHSSGVFGKFLRRDSAVHERKKKTLGPRVNLNKQQSGNVSGDDVINGDNQVKKPLIAKWKAGASKFHVSTCSESDELVEGLTRAQRRLEDQRGTEINFELPDFLKDKENEQHNRQLNSQKPVNSPQKVITSYSPSRYSPQKTTVLAAKNMKLDIQSNYENRNVLVTSPLTNLPELKSSQISENCEVSPENSIKTPLRSVDPPPLPPKPKIIPIKPPNWGFYKEENKELVSDRSQGNMFLEQPSSSFV